MPGEIKRMLDRIIQTRAKGNPTLMAVTKTKIILKGLNPDKFSSSSADDAAIIGKVRQVAAELGVSL